MKQQSQAAGKKVPEPADGQQPVARPANPDVAPSTQGKQNVPQLKPLTRPEDVDLSVIYIYAPDLSGEVRTLSMLELHQMGLGIETYRWFIRNLVSNVIGLEEGEEIRLVNIQRMIAFLDNLGFTIVRATKEFKKDEQTTEQGSKEGAPEKPVEHQSKDVKSESKKVGDNGKEASGKGKKDQKSKQAGKPSKNRKKA